MSRWHTDRPEPAGAHHAQALCAPQGRLAGIVRHHGLALGVSRQNRLVWLLAFALALAAHLAMTVWLMMSIAPQTGTQQPAAVSMLFEAPKAPLPAAAQMQATQTPIPPPVQPAPPMKDMPDMDAQTLTQNEGVVLPPSVRPEVDHLPPVSALPKKLVKPGPAMQHDKGEHMKAESQPDAAHTAGAGATATARAKTDMAATGAQAAAPASAAAAGQKGGFQLSCSAPESHYPVSARHLHEEGEAVAEVSINGKGQVIAARLVKSTGYDDLDDQALQTVKNLHCTPPDSAVVTGRIPVGFHIQ
ncbi:energy transducer TonB [Acetobacter sp. LMG 32666]|uniref:energy transducer TonB n=1 Tax=Acetobacter sp. LMG 32666 TaxID=2959295 RepID=UPI0030C8C84D